ncbi:MAG: DNA polymerase/3'-5' exonuclease PolX [Elusimicrobia bacterium]|nr:DNA polymerase/3'-5' exonuclease PolX [Elusimicrobiota bacterium]
MQNPLFAAVLSEMATLLDLENENVFRVRAYQRAAQIIEVLPKDIEAMSKEDLMSIEGIGKGIADKAYEFVKTGRVKEHLDLRKKFPEGLLSLLKVPGLGPRRARLLYDNLAIDSPEKLRLAAAQGRLNQLRGFGKKIEEKIVKGLTLSEETSKRILLWEARSLMQGMLEVVRGMPGVVQAEPAGSLRRGKETVGDLDILCAASRPETVSKKFSAMPFVKQVLAVGPTKVSVLLANNAQCDLRVVDPACFGAALLYFTGSKEHNVALRERAQGLGLTLSEYGLFRLSDRKQAKPLAGKTEEDVYKRLGLQFIPPELRENRGEIAASAEKRLPDLVEEKDIKGCFHNHTLESDGVDSLEDMVKAARSKGWEWYAVGDHSQSLKIAKGLEPSRLKKKLAKLSEAAKKNKDIRVLSASEVDILNDGRLDYEDDLLKRLDIVVGSVHSGFHQPEEQITKRILSAMENPHVDCIAHLSGRLLGKREPYKFNIDKIIERAARTGTALEINGQPERQDLNDVHARAVKDGGAPLAANTDAHSRDQLGFMSLAVTVARRAWVEKKDLLNTKTWPELQEWLKSR